LDLPDASHRVQYRTVGQAIDAASEGAKSSTVKKKLFFARIYQC